MESKWRANGANGEGYSLEGDFPHTPHPQDLNCLSSLVFAESAVSVRDWYGQGVYSARRVNKLASDAVRGSIYEGNYR